MVYCVKLTLHGTGHPEPSQGLRVARAWTQEQLADAVGVSRQSINSIERERYVPSLQLALTFARVFGCSTEKIFKLESEK